MAASYEEALGSNALINGPRNNSRDSRRGLEIQKFIPIFTNS